MRATEFITESFNKPYPWRQARSKRSMAQYIFRANSMFKRYNISFNLDANDKVSVQFGRYTLSGLVHHKTKDSMREAIRIFATVGDVIMDFVKNNPGVDTIYFTGNTEDGEDEKSSSRIQLYDRLATRLKEQLGWPNLKRTAEDAITHNGRVVEWEINKGDSELSAGKDRDYETAIAARTKSRRIDKIYPMSKVQAIDRVLLK